MNQFLLVIFVLWFLWGGTSYFFVTELRFVKNFRINIGHFIELLSKFTKEDVIRNYELHFIDYYAMESRFPIPFDSTQTPGFDYEFPIFLCWRKKEFEKLMVNEVFRFCVEEYCKQYRDLTQKRVIVILLVLISLTVAVTFF